MLAMTPEKILFVGLGGAGQRHLRMFYERLGDKVEMLAYRATGKTPVLNPDFSVREGSTLEDLYGLTNFADLDAALDAGPDLVVISTPSSQHLEAAKAAAERSAHVFVEKPFSHTLDGFADFRRAVLDNELVFQMSFQRRFHPHLARVRELISEGRIGRPINAVFTVASYVPAWHPYEDFHELYAVRASLGGGVLLTEIHELDLCTWYFGAPESVSCVGGNFSGVALDVEDTAQLTLNYGNFSVQVNLCFMQRHNRRDFFIAGDKGYVEWNQDGNVLRVEDYETGEKTDLPDPAFTNDSMFAAQADFVLGDLGPRHSAANLEATLNSLAIVEAARQSMNNGRAVALGDILAT
jgi:predicted dehydrogenase